MLEPVLAAGELDIFVHMMTRKNIELQLQALQMIEAMCGALPAGPPLPLPAPSCLTPRCLRLKC